MKWRHVRRPPLRSDLTSGMEATYGDEMMRRRGALLFFKFIRQISRSHGAKFCKFLPKLDVSRLLTHFEFNDGNEMMHKAWGGIEEVPHCFSKFWHFRFCSKMDEGMFGA